MEEFEFSNGGELSSAWLPPYSVSGQIMTGSDPSYLARAMLEPIMEETSDDDDSGGASPHELWSQYEQAWSSASDTGSVIRVEINQDQDTISERDFACPAKRRRHDEINDELVQLRRPQLLLSSSLPQRNDIEFKYRIDCVDPPTDNFGKRYRLDDNNDLYSDSDSISFNSLSRSSSLVQFETLERQLQGSGDGHSFGGSTPSLHSTHAYDDTHKSDSLKRFSDTSEIKGARNYFNVNKIDFTATPYLNIHHHSHQQQQQKLRGSNDNRINIDTDNIDGVGSDESSSSENSLYSESHGSDTDETILKIQRQPINVDGKSTSITYRCKNSVENLSEDSGYCEYSSLKVRSKSIPNFVGQPEHFIEEEEFENHKSLENIIKTTTQQQQQKQQSYNIYKHSGDHEPLTTTTTTTTPALRTYNNNCTTKIDLTQTIANTKRYSAPPTYSNTLDIVDAKNIMRNITNSQNSLRHSTQNISASLPNLSEHIDSSSSSSSVSRSSSNASSSPSSSAASSDDDETLLSKNSIEKRRGANNNYLRKTTTSSSLKKQKKKSKNQFISDVNGEKDFSIVSSVPNNLNICINDDDCGNNGSARDTFGWNLTNFTGSYCSSGGGSASKNNNPSTRLSVASKNLDLCDFAGSSVSGGSSGILSNSNSYIQSIDVLRQQKVINASYSNLTALDYSGTRQQLTTTFRKMAADNRKRNSGEFSRCNFLLDEISTNFDRELSILNDQREHYDPVTRFIKEEKIDECGSGGSSTRSTPPKPPPRKMHLQQKVYSEVNASVSAPIELKPSSVQYCDDVTVKKSPLLSLQRYTFDRDPTNLVTCYAESLERCNFDIHGSTSSINSNKNLDNTLIPNTSRHSTPVHRQMVQSTPNLNIYKSVETDDFMQLPSTHTSLNPLPQIGGSTVLGGGVAVNVVNGEKLQGILSLGSRTSLGKGVSFCPIVSEISWKEQSSEEMVEDGDDANDTDDYADDSLDNCDSSEKIISDEYNTTNNNSIRDNVYESDHNSKTIMPSRSLTKSITTTTNTIPITTFDVQLQPQQLTLTTKETDSSTVNNHHHRHYEPYNQQQHNTTVSYNKISPNVIASSNAMIVNESVPLTVASSTVTTINTNNNNKDSVRPNNSSSGNNNKNSDNTSASGGSEHLIHNQLNVDRNYQPIKGRRMEGAPGLKRPINNNEFILSQQQHNTQLMNNNPSNMDNSQSVNVVKPEKKHKGGFLSRFSGFRFSLRGKKKPTKLFENNNATVINGSGSGSSDQPQLRSGKNSGSGSNFINGNNGANNRNSVNNDNNRNSVNKTNDFIYIPLKDPLTGKLSNDATPKSIVGDGTYGIHAPLYQQQQHRDSTNNSDKPDGHVLTTKPPLPRQPPRVVGVCAKPPSSAAVAVNAHNNNRISADSNNGQHQRYGHAQRASSAPREIDVNDHLRSPLDDEDFYNQFRSDIMTSSHMDGGGDVSMYYTGGAANLSAASDKTGGVGAGGKVIGDDGCEYKIGLIETNLDTHETIISGKTRSLMELGPQQIGVVGQRHSTNIHHHHHHPGRNVTAVEPRRPHKSMEFLLDKENQQKVLPPENELQKSHDNNVALSEHQLRVQASLQRLNIPEWYRQYSTTQSKQPGDGTGTGAYVPGSFTKKRNSDIGRWTGLNSKTTSLSSLGSHRSDRSPLLLSPSAHSHHGQTGFSRWSTSHLNSSQTSPSASVRSSFSRGGTLNASILSAGHSSVTSAGNNSSIRNSFRQPYMGWRSQEKLAQPRTPAERLASSLLARQQNKQEQQQHHQQHQPPQPAVTPEIQSSIKEVTSAIVHYVNDQTNRTSNSRSRSTSPTTRKCWLESSFVGNRPLDSPQTPVIETSFTPRSSSGNTAISSAALQSARMNGVATPIPILSVQQTDRPSPSSTTLEDVLASLLGLPTDSYRDSGDITANDSTNTVFGQNCSSRLQIDNSHSLRRHSEGDAQKRSMDTVTAGITTQHNRRISLDSSDSKPDTETVKCRYPKCDAATTVIDAKKSYKSCHNCSHMYCSRECRRSHWEKHRKACLHSRVSALCRQVLSACKDDADTLRHLSLLARKGYVSQGRGVVRILFRSPESAEQFVKQGFQCIGEASYVRWPELMPQEMGPELYSELLRLSTEYKTDSKMLIYVAICVVSETPGSGAAPVKWERQLVSRCAKLKLSKAIPNDLAQLTKNSVQQQQQQSTSHQHQQQQLPQQQFEQNTDILILAFNVTMKKGNTMTPISSKSRELILTNIQNILKRRGVNMKKIFPEVFQRLYSFVEGTTDRFLPVTIHPRDAITGRAFICIIMPNTSDSERIKLPESDGSNSIQIIDCLENVEWN